MTLVVDARERYVADFRAFATNGGGAAPPWLRDVRERAIARFAELGFPSMKQEEWRFTSVAPIVERTFERSHDRPALTSFDLDALSVAGGGAIRLVVVNGAFVPELSSGDVPAGLRAASLRGALAADPDLARHHLAHSALYENSAFAALNTAFLSDGAFVHVPAGMDVARPIEIIVVAAPAAGAGPMPIVAHPRCLVVLDAGARANVIEHYVALRDGVYWTNAVSEVALGAGAQLEYVRLQRESRDAYQVATTHTTQARDSLLRLHPIVLGAGLARHDVHTVLGGPGSELVLNGFYLLRGTQHADHHTVIEHTQPHGTSHEFFNGIVAEQAHAVFSGRIIVRPGAQRTDSKQTNNNLLLSADARADSQPQLEIYADDVKCTHGSTVGPLDETAVYYLRSRGLSPETAAAMLTYGLAAEILDRVRQGAVRDALERLVRRRFADRSRGGRRA